MSDLHGNRNIFDIATDVAKVSRALWEDWISGISLPIFSQALKRQQLIITSLEVGVSVVH